MITWCCTFQCMLFRSNIRIKYICKKYVICIFDLINVYFNREIYIFIFNRRNYIIVLNRFNSLGLSDIIRSSKFYFDILLFSIID